MGTFSPAEWAVGHLRKLEEKGFAPDQLESACKSMAQSVMGNHYTRWNVRSCQACPSYAGCQVKALGYGSFNSPIMIVSERATADDIMWGQAMVSTEGFLLDFLLDKLGVDRSMVYTTTLVKCHKTGFEAGRDEAEMCLAHLAQEIEAIQPAVILTFGQLVPSVILGDEGFRLTMPPRSPEDRDGYLASNWREYSGFKIRPTYPLRSILETEGERQALAKQTIWTDFRAVLQKAEELRPNYNYRLSRPAAAV